MIDCSFAGKKIKPCGDSEMATVQCQIIQLVNKTLPRTTYLEGHLIFTILHRTTMPSLKNTSAGLPELSILPLVVIYFVSVILIKFTKLTRTTFRQQTNVQLQGPRTFLFQSSQLFIDSHSFNIFPQHIQLINQNNTKLNKKPAAVDPLVFMPMRALLQPPQLTAPTLYIATW